MKTAVGSIAVRPLWYVVLREMSWVRTGFCTGVR